MSDEDPLCVALAEIERRSAVMVREQLWAAWGRPERDEAPRHEAEALSVRR